MSPRLRALARLLFAELRYLDARCIRRRFCMHCDKQTIRQHNHHLLYSEEWRRG